ncbi:hypothetical protein J5N97_005764 [Dioscorea zingiberensis]|uniref:BHLH domain-containing protein n=1 Tax=Dioscorea zingiberensis TaxID=325984 RepID=A0A9D5HSM4_9LILI|nr:hypothetical protein J5N97_005764 [Dioscorea zingiberensis]
MDWSALYRPGIVFLTATGTPGSDPKMSGSLNEFKGQRKKKSMWAPLIGRVVVDHANVQFTDGIAYCCHIRANLCSSLSTGLKVKLEPKSKMSGRRSRITEEEINELISKLQTILPESRRRNTSRVSATKLLKETCSYIKSLHREVDGLSDRLSELMNTMDANSAQAEIIRGLLRS